MESKVHVPGADRYRLKEAGRSLFSNQGGIAGKTLVPAMKTIARGGSFFIEALISCNQKKEALTCWIGNYFATILMR